MTGATIRIALAIVRLFPNGGLQRDCMAIARRLSALGHDVQVVCASSEVTADDLDIVVLKNAAISNHGRNRAFSAALRRHVGQAFDVVAGFDSLEDLDVLYCANPPVRIRGLLDRMNPRKRALLRLERACFGAESRTGLLLLSTAQRDHYQQRWHMDRSRVTLIPPTIERDRVVPHRADVRRSVRGLLGFTDADTLWLFVGTFPKTKGLDRLIAVLPQFAAVKLICIGTSANDIATFGATARQAGVGDRISWLGIRHDVGDLMVAADMLVHPARLDITGTVILEAIANGLPVIATGVCGYAHHVGDAGAGLVLDEPFTEQKLIDALNVSCDPAIRGQWSVRAAGYSLVVDLFSGLDVAAATIAATPSRRLPR